MKKISLMVGFMLAASLCFAQKSEVYVKNGLAIDGYDPVAYFVGNKEVKGEEKFSFEWERAKWLFSSEKNRELFQSDPLKYAPQYGGYCAYGMSNGYKAPISANAFTIVEGKLYLNYNTDVRKEWDKDQKNRIEKADNHWRDLKKKG